MRATEYFLQLELAGRHAEAQAFAEKIIKFYKEDLTKDNRENDGTCDDCGYVFVDGNVQCGEFEPHTLCEACYCDRGGK